MTSAAKRKFAFLIQTEDNYGSPRLTARVVYRDEEGKLLHPSTYEDGFELRDFTVHAYIETNGDSRRIWGSNHSFTPCSLNLMEAESVVKVLRKVSKGLSKIQADEGWVNDEDFATHVFRIARVLGISEYYVRNSAKSRSATGEFYRKADGVSVQMWLADADNLRVQR